MRFLLSRRWALFAAAVVLLAYVAYLLGQWQFHRLEDRETANAQTRSNLVAEPVPVAEVLAPGRDTDRADEWRRVRATGTYVPEDSVVIRYQTRDGASGVDIVTPLRTREGPVLLVDRGWMRSDNSGADVVEAPPPPSGEVTVVGFVRADAEGDSAAVTDGSARAVSSREIARTLTGPVYGGFVDAESETPPPSTRLVPAELPDLGEGPHFFYGLQWWFFGVLAVFGFCYLAYDERRALRSPPPDQGHRGPSPRRLRGRSTAPPTAPPTAVERATAPVRQSEAPRAQDEARSG